MEVETHELCCTVAVIAVAALVPEHMTSMEERAENYGVEVENR